MIKPRSIDHVCLWVKSLAETKIYYQKVFGFTCQPREDDEYTLVVESDTVHFFISENQSPDEAYLAQQHLSFEVDSLEEVVESLAQLGIKDYACGVVSVFSHNNYKWCEWRDPSGIRLECVERIS